MWVDSWLVQVATKRVGENRIGAARKPPELPGGRLRRRPIRECFHKPGSRLRVDASWPVQAGRLFFLLLASLRLGMISNVPLLESRHVGRRHPDGQRWLLDDVSIAVQPGQRWGLTGASGSGKTLLLRALARLDPHVLFAIPLLGVILGNTPNGISLGLNRLGAELEGNRDLVETFIVRR